MTTKMPVWLTPSNKHTFFKVSEEIRFASLRPLAVAACLVEDATVLAYFREGYASVNQELKYEGVMDVTTKFVIYTKSEETLAALVALARAILKKEYPDAEVTESVDDVASEKLVDKMALDILTKSETPFWK